MMARWHFGATKLDRQIAKAVARNATPAIERRSRLLTWVAAGLWLAARAGDDSQRQQADHLVLSVVATAILPHVLKWLIDQERPDRCMVPWAPSWHSTVARDTTLVYASRAPQTDIARLKARMGWEMFWYTITDSFDAAFGVDEWHGHNAFIRDGERVFRTYFINSRGDEAMGTTWSYLDGGLSSEPTVQVVELARQLRARRRARPEVGRGVGRRRGRISETRRRGETMTEAYHANSSGP